MNLVRKSNTRATSYAILGGIKEVIGMLSRSRATDTSEFVEEILDFGLRGVARPELLKFIPTRDDRAGEESPEAAFFLEQKLD
jgi:hypothetical protein